MGLNTSEKQKKQLTTRQKLNRNLEILATKYPDQTERQFRIGVVSALQLLNLELEEMQHNG